MKKQEDFSIEAKRQIIEELINGISTPSQICHRHNITPGILPKWKRQYELGKYDDSECGISAPLAYATNDNILCPSLPSAYIRVLRMVNAMGITSDMPHPESLISTN